ncbi:unnamed protein product [Porites lobata]|uniref:Uncharacterized protein n=1 Tax=Porites lobata TaxID=104759 RepID=A0ABN8N5M7_9CNID|nr:unnamed protein product [Porites lobata]
MAFSSGKKVHLLVSILAAITLIIFSHSGILHLKLKMKSVHCIPKTELNEQATPFQNEVEGFVKVQARHVVFYCKVAACGFLCLLYQTLTSDRWLKKLVFSKALDLNYYRTFRK